MGVSPQICLYKLYIGVSSQICPSEQLVACAVMSASHKIRRDRTKRGLGPVSLPRVTWAPNLWRRLLLPPPRPCREPRVTRVAGSREGTTPCRCFVAARSAGCFPAAWRQRVAVMVLGRGGGMAGGGCVAWISASVLSLLRRHDAGWWPSVSASWS